MARKEGRFRRMHTNGRKLREGSPVLLKERRKKKVTDSR